MDSARIYQKAKNAMQSGRAGTDRWILEFMPSAPQRANPMMGWAGSTDTRRQLRLNFPSVEAAEAYAKSNGINAVVEQAQPRLLKLQAYSDNFR